MDFRRWLAFLPAAVLLAVAASAQDNSLAERLDGYLRACAPFGWSGTVLVGKAGEPLLSRGYGLADPKSRRPNTPQTLLEIASITKQFTAAAVLKLEEMGKLSTSDPIAKHLPGVPQSCARITVYHLLTHTSGMPRTNGRGRGEDLERAVRAFLAGGPKRRLGAKFEYWNGGYSLLAGIVERASGLSYMAFCSKHLFAPAGMKSSGFTGDGHLEAGRAAIGTSRMGAPRGALEHPYRSYGWQYRGMGGAVTTVVDMWLWHRALLGEKVLGKEAKKKLFRPYRNNYACGWHVKPAVHGKVCHSHGGGVRGFLSMYRRYPDDDACIVVLANRDDVPVHMLADNLECMLFGKPLKYAAPPLVVTLDEAAMKEYEGRYRGADDARLVVRAEREGLVVGINGQDAVWALSTITWPGTWSARGLDLEGTGRKALGIVNAVARGDPVPLRKAMAKGIPPTWPATVVREIWPAHVKKHGPFKRARVLGSVTVGRRIRVVLALEHEKKPARVRVEFDRGGLRILDWNGPDFAASIRLLPTGKDRFVEVRWQSPKRFRFDRGRGRVTALRLGARAFVRQR